MLSLLSVFEQQKIPYSVPEIMVQKGNEFIPSHFSAMIKNTQYPNRLELDYDEAILYLSKQWKPEGDIRNGWIQLFFKEVSLGWAKGIGSKRINNYYPLRYRIRNP